MKKTYTDDITKKTIFYELSDIFMIKTRHGYNKKVIKKVFYHAKIEDIFKEFYAMPIKKGAFKYLYRQSDGRTQGDLILRMKGQASKLELDDLRLKSTRTKINYSHVAIGNLTKCPKSLADLIAKEDYSSYPASISKWTTQKLTYAILSYYFDLPRESKMEILRQSEESLFSHKEKSGHSLEEENKIKVDVVTKDDLL